MFEEAASNLNIWEDCSPTGTTWTPDEIREVLERGHMVSVEIVTPYHYLGFVKEVKGNVLFFTDGTKLKML